MATAEVAVLCGAVTEVFWREVFEPKLEVSGGINALGSVAVLTV